MALDQYVSMMKSRVGSLSRSEMMEAADEIRRLCGSAYDQIFAEARSLGKDDRFSHEAALFRAASIILTGDEYPERDLAHEIQLEHVPFNKDYSQESREAFAEYMVWKLLGSDFWTSEKFNKYMQKFKATIFHDAESKDNADEYVYRMLYSGLYDWQDLLAGPIVTVS
ncbi:hypothetical protein C7I87_20885 [Mesorhizobium sp. SARCC-RB16n]|uniref:hypothetical protein n=1 Tax=Mesorhizobium sp. SARCC-RB16n TaxID=2116687 RepID=UPI00122F59D0|nr:hypothetical protein [Mesorhizobium sp. SARCC-RB16n]KAA3448610.1 hypothetical protein C7I87_20885 [Mesorhizobium sp. SARCC-RB16n]